MLRALYVCVLRSHPPYFRARFSDEMLAIFDQETGSVAAAMLILDGVRSLLRQWILRPEFQFEAAPILREPAPAFSIIDDGWFSGGALIKGLALTIAIFCLFGVVLVYEHVIVFPTRHLAVQDYGLAVLSPGFSPEKYDAARHAEKDLGYSIEGSVTQPGDQRPAAEPAVQAQIDAVGRMAFDEVSVRQDNSGLPSAGAKSSSNPALSPGDDQATNGGHFSAVNIQLNTLIAFAYELTGSGSELRNFTFQLPNRIATERFDIEARAEGNPLRPRCG